MAAWYIVIFENCIEAQFIASMNFANELYSAFMNNPVHIDGARESANKSGTWPLLILHLSI